MKKKSEEEGKHTGDRGKMTRRSRIQGGTPKSPIGAMSQSGAGRGAKSESAKDIQTVLDRLDKIEKSLEAKIDNSIQSQEFAAKQLTDNIKKVESSTLQAHEKSDKLAEESIGIKAQLRVHGTQLLEREKEEEYPGD